MAEIQDIDGQNDDIGEIEAVDNATSQQQSAEDNLPEKYRGKSAAEIARMHHEAEKLIERQGREVGEVRKLADELLRSQLEARHQPQEQQKVDFFENPDEAVRQQIENNPKLRAVEEYAMQAQRQAAQMQFFQKHPDASAVLSDPTFHEWVKSSRVRQQLFQVADSGYDVEAADELLSTFKQLKSVRQQKMETVDNEALNKSLRSASVDTGGAGETTRKVYRRADLIRLKINNPQKYSAMEDEIYRAYQEGRVK